MYNSEKLERVTIELTEKGIEISTHLHLIQPCTV